MFRDTAGSEISDKNFGVGSTIQKEDKEYLVVAQGTAVQLLNLKTFVLLDYRIQPQDLNFLSQAEVEDLTRCLDTPFSDLVCFPKGLKGIKTPIL